MTYQKYSIIVSIYIKRQFVSRAHKFIERSQSTADATHLESKAESRIYPSDRKAMTRHPIIISGGLKLVALLLVTSFVTLGVHGSVLGKSVRISI